MNTSKHAQKFSEALKFCQEQQISAESPGTILKDIQAVIEAIGPGVTTSGKSENLPQAMLPCLNEKMCDPMQIPLKRALMKDYPNISGMYILLRVMGLLKIDGKKITLDPKRMAEWNSLNSTGKYFSLLEAWLLEAKTSVLGRVGDSPRVEDPNLVIYVPTIATWPMSTWKDTRWVRGANIWNLIERWNFQLLMRFGLAKVRDNGKRIPGDSPNWRPSEMKVTPWGQAIAYRILETIAANDPDDVEDELFLWRAPGDAEGMITQSFQPSFPELKRTLSTLEMPVVEGQFVFRVTVDRYPGVMRRIVCSFKTSLDSVASYVLSAFDFDEDHLYEFSYRDLAGQKRVYLHPYCEDGESAEDITLGESGLAEKSDLRFHFDFGDDWRFNLRLEKIEPPTKGVKNGQILESKGAAPEQYPSDDG